MSSESKDAFTAFRERIAGQLPERIPSSCRFRPYFKAQWYDPKTMAWRDVAKRFPTEDEARTCFTKRKEWRLMEVSMTGRRVL